MSRRLLAWVLVGVCVVSLSISYPSHAPGPLPVASTQPAAKSDHAAKVDYDRDVLPILSSKCFTCHGPDAKARKAGLRLDVREMATKRSKTGDVPIVPGKAADSEVVRRIYAEDESERMPPQKGGKELTESEKQLIKRWIDQGAEYKQHWAFVKVERPAPPLVKDKAWGKNDIDAFILHRLEAAGLRPSPQTDRVTLIRR